MIPHNRGDHAGDGLGLEAPKDLLERAQQRRPLLQQGRPLWPPAAPPRADAPEGKSQEGKGLPLRQIHETALLFIDLDLEERQLLAEPFGDRREEPGMAGMGVHQDDQIIGKPRVLKSRVFAESSDRLGAL
jgi:hypothetical protein